MKKILIVDDEPFIAKSIQLMIESIDVDCLVCGVANNGKQALTLCETLHPDILLTDIRMPVMDGLELIQTLLQKTTPPLFIILSGYGEFEYAQKALKMGVFDYLLKPVDPSALSDVLGRAVGTLSSNYKKDSSRILWDILSSPNVLPHSDFINRHFSDISYSFMIINAGSYFHFSYSPASTYTDFWETYNLLSVLPDIESAGGWIVSGIRPNERIIIFDSKIAGLPEMLFREIFDLLNGSPIPISSICGEHIGEIYTLNESISKYRLLLNRNAMFGYSSFISPTPAPTDSKGQFQLSRSEKEELALLFQNGNKTELSQYITKKICYYEQQKIRQIDLQFFLLEILYLLDSKLPPTERDQENLLYFVTDIINNTWSYKMLTDDFLRLVCELLDTLKKGEDNTSHTTIVDQIENYIYQHYTENLTLQKLADVFGFVPPYLSRIYKKERGISPSDHILNLKIERIKHLLKNDSHLSLKKIAETTGFNDPFYMSKVFKMATGFTPSEYRAKHTARI